MSTLRVEQLSFALFMVSSEPRPLSSVNPLWRTRPGRTRGESRELLAPELD